jgi:cytochrome c oxidase subunit 1/cytochrome c oxidase subunit I+III
VTVGFISFGVWVHHMFATGIPALALSFFSAASLIITLPSGVQFFAWIATMWKGVVHFSTAMLFAIGFLLIFLLGGITGVMVAVVPFDWQVTDSYFVVAHFHYVLNGAVVFPIFGAIYYWMPKMTGRMLDERLGRISFWTMFVGFNLAFFPMHVLGLLGMPRRVYTYQPGLGWDGLNVLATIGGFMFAIGTGITLVNFVISRRRGAPAGPNPWQADTLEWAIASPPPHYNFAAIPVVYSRHPLWDEEFAIATSGEDRATEAFGEEGAAARETPITAGLQADAEDTMVVPPETVLPFVLALGIALFFVGLIVEGPIIGVIGVGLGIVGILWWAWRTGE